MLQFDVALCRARDNVAHKVRRYIQLFVASEHLSDVEGFVPDRVHVSSYEQQPDSPSANLRFPHLELALGYKAEALYDGPHIEPPSLP